VGEDSTSTSVGFPAQVDTLLFDLDGTLIDTIPLIFASLRHALHSVLGVQVTPGDVRQFAGMPLAEIMAHYSAEKVERLVEVYRGYYEDNDASTLFPGVRTVIEQLSEGFRLGLVTTKSKVAAGPHLCVHRLRDFFTTVVCAEDVSRLKPDPEPILLALARMGRSPCSAVMIGDSPSDMTAGKRAGVLTAWALWGSVHHRGALCHPPDFVVERPRDILTLAGIDSCPEIDR